MPNPVDQTASSHILGTFMRNKQYGHLQILELSWQDPKHPYLPS